MSHDLGIAEIVGQVLSEWIRRPIMRCLLRNRRLFWWFSLLFCVGGIVLFVGASIALYPSSWLWATIAFTALYGIGLLWLLIGLRGQAWDALCDKLDELNEDA